MTCVQDHWLSKSAKKTTLISFINLPHKMFHTFTLACKIINILKFCPLVDISFPKNPESSDEMHTVMPIRSCHSWCSRSSD